MNEPSGSSPLIVAIDGPSGVGKSTVARKVAERLGLPYLSTGAMYRALALKVLESNTDPEDRSAVEEVVISRPPNCGKTPPGAATGWNTLPLRRRCRP